MKNITTSINKNYWGPKWVTMVMSIGWMAGHHIQAKAVDKYPKHHKNLGKYYFY